MVIIGLGRRKSVGKDTLALYLKWHMLDLSSQLKISIVGIADKVKDISYDLYAWAGMKERSYYETKHGYQQRDIILPGVGKSPRQIWIELGTLVGRELYPDSWLVHELARTLKAPCDVLIIKDVRFANEIKILKALNAYLIQVENPRIPLPTDVADTQSLPPNWYDIELVNGGTKGAFMDQAERLSGFILDNRPNLSIANYRLADTLHIAQDYWLTERRRDELNLLGSPTNPIVL